MKNLLKMLAEKKFDPCYPPIGNFIHWFDIEKIVTEYMTEMEKGNIELGVEKESNRIIELVKKLDIKDGDFLLVKAKGELNNNSFYNLFAERLRYMLDKNELEKVVVVLVGGETELELLDENMMIEAGWLKKEKVDELMGNIIKDEDGFVELFRDKELVIKLNDNNILEINGMRYSSELFKAWSKDGLPLYTQFVLMDRVDGVITIKKSENIIGTN
jgi:hypothetical protein